MNYLEIILITYCALLFLALICYIPKFKCWVFGFKKTEKLTNEKKSKIALLIPAKNESECISPLFDSINNQTYNKSLFDVFIIVDNEQDETINIAKNKLHNASIVVEKNQKCKADALDTAIKYIYESSLNIYDAYIVVDADNILTDNFVEEMNNALVTKADVIIGKKLIKNWESTNKKHRTLFTNLSALTYTGLDTMGNKYKTTKGCALALCGQGMLLSKKFVDRYKGFPFKTLCEDVEVGVHAMLNDDKQFYYEHALIYSEEPVTHKEYNKRRYRWLKGYFDNNKKYRKALLKKTFGQGKIVNENLHFLYDLTPVYFMIGTTAVALVTYLVNSIVLAIMKSSLLKESLLLTLLMFVIIYGMIALFNFVTVIEDKDTNKMSLSEKLKVVFLGPLITFEYVIIFFKTIRSDFKVNWEHVERINLDEKN